MPAVLKHILVYSASLAIGIPWYWPADDVSVAAGLPVWVLIAIGTSACASVYTVYLLHRPWRDESDEQ